MTVTVFIPGHSCAQCSWPKKIQTPPTKISLIALYNVGKVKAQLIMMPLNKAVTVARVSQTEMNNSSNQ